MQPEPVFTENALKVLRARYLLRDEHMRIIETPAQMLERVARAVALAEPPAMRERASEMFYELMAERWFLPNSPTLMNAGTPRGQLSACFVLPVPDSIEGIFDALKHMALIHQSGGGTGFSFSELRPKGYKVKSTGGVASGPVSFMTVFDRATEVIKQGGKRRGANMGILSVHHPDVLEFIRSKLDGRTLTNFNLSVAATDAFMEAAISDDEYVLTSPQDGSTRSMPASEVLDELARAAWSIGDPGMLFIDEINRHNPNPTLGRIEATNPCGEQPLLSYESCNLGSINLAMMVEDGKVVWDRLEHCTRWAVRFLDDVIDVNVFPLAQIEKMTRRTRKIGLGVMGFADMLIELGIPYGSQRSYRLAEKLMEHIQTTARAESEALGLERGSFPAFAESTLSDAYDHMRNSTTTTIAPTGTISIIADCSSGIEPLFSVAYVREALEGELLVHRDERFERLARERGFYSSKLADELSHSLSLRDVKGVPEDVAELFRCALDLSPEQHVRMQAAFQRYTDNAVSKTVNMSEDASVDDIRRVFVLAWRLGCKGITVFRYRSRDRQVISVFGDRVHVKGDVVIGATCPANVCPL